jgi:hypothetical protein
MYKPIRNPHFRGRGAVGAEHSSPGPARCSCHPQSRYWAMGGGNRLRESRCSDESRGHSESGDEHLHFENRCKISAVGLHISGGGSKSQCLCINSRYGDEVQLLLIIR